MIPGPQLLEIGQSAIGIIVPEDSRHVRFFAAGAPYDPLDGHLFRSAREVLAAAKALRERGERRRVASARGL